MEGSFSWRLLCVSSRVQAQGWAGAGGGDLKDSEAVAPIDFSLSDPLA